jgi:Fic family protein
MEMNKQHPIITASVAHYNHVRIHPFQDGNGRGSRILMNLILMRHHFTPAIIEVSKRKEYLSCLKAADKGDLVPFTEFVTDSVNKTQRTVLEAVNEYLDNNGRPSSSIKPKC